MDAFVIREVVTGKGKLCASILATLPHWFGFPEVNAGYALQVEPMRVFGAYSGERPLGFFAFAHHTPRSSKSTSWASLPMSTAMVSGARSWRPPSPLPSPPERVC